MTPDALDALIRLHEGLPRQGPGDPEALARMVERLALPEIPKAADMGCGSGSAARWLAETLGADVLAIDAAAPFIDDLRRGLANAPPRRGRVTARVGDMLAPEIAPGSLDLIVSEGAAYAVGFAEALAAWRPLVRPGGGLVVSECVWFGTVRPEPAAAFWRKDYPAMDTPAAAIAAAERAGWRLVAAERLTAAAWRQSYYGPLAARMDRLAPDADPALARAIAEARAEMDVFARFCDSYGYVLFAFDAAP